MPDAQRLDTFARVIEAGSISRAALRLCVDKSVVSRQIAKLEAELGARLLQRTTRRVALTEIAEQVLQQARVIQEALQNIEQMTDAYRQEVSGRLRISRSISSQRVPVPLVLAFGERHPQVQVVLQSDDRLVDLLAEQIDVAICVAPLGDSTLVARKLADSSRVCVASPAYLVRPGEPRAPCDLVAHQCVVYCNETRAFDEWRFDGPVGRETVAVSGRLQMNDGGTVADAVVTGAGLAVLDALIVREELRSGALRAVLPGYQIPPGPPVRGVSGAPLARADDRCVHRVRAALPAARARARLSRLRATNCWLRGDRRRAADRGGPQTLPGSQSIVRRGKRGATAMVALRVATPRPPGPRRRHTQPRQYATRLRRPSIPMPHPAVDARAAR